MLQICDILVRIRIQMLLVSSLTFKTPTKNYFFQYFSAYYFLKVPYILLYIIFQIDVDNTTVFVAGESLLSPANPADPLDHSLGGAQPDLRELSGGFPEDHSGHQHRGVQSNHTGCQACHRLLSHQTNRGRMSIWENMLRSLWP